VLHDHHTFKTSIFLKIFVPHYRCCVCLFLCFKASDFVSGDGNWREEQKL